VLVPLRERLEAAGIPCDFRMVDASRPETIYTTAEMIDWYNSGTVYVCASSSEGTPNPCLEAAACGCALVTTPVGNMTELTPAAYILRDVDDAYRECEWALDHYLGEVQLLQSDIGDWSWRERAVKYYDLFRRLIKEAQHGRVGSGRRMVPQAT
jgi:glycosyltransferase involved in cell wall biosynthesis